MNSAGENVICSCNDCIDDCNYYTYDSSICKACKCDPTGWCKRCPESYGHCYNNPNEYIKCNGDYGFIWENLTAIWIYHLMNLYPKDSMLS